MQQPIPIWRRYAEVRTEVVGPIVSRVFSPQNGFAERVKHIIEPNFSIHRTTNVTNQDLVPFTGSTYDTIIGKTTRMNYGLTNRLMVRKAPKEPEEGEPVPLATAGAPRELLSVSIYQTYYTDARASLVDTTVQSAGYRGANSFSPIVLNARSAPTELSTATVLAEYDATLGLLNTLSATGGVNYRQVQARAGWSNRLICNGASCTGLLFSRTNNLDANATLNFAGGRSGGMYSMNWDITRNQMVQQRVTGFYNSQCCGLIAEYQVFTFGVGSVVPQDRRFNMSFSLAGVGSFTNFFGMFGGTRY